MVFIVPLASLAVTVDGASKTSQKKKASKAKSKAKTASKKTAKCNTNYSGCVPIASDVDCKPGTGNGPAYIYSAVKVLKKDVYALDRDKDGWGCEKN